MKKALLAACLLGFASSVSAQETELWRIGSFDKSSHEFKDSFDVDYLTDRKPQLFTVGLNHDSDWLRFQPGPANGIAGGREHPFQIRFHLDSLPSGTYSLRVAILYETPRLSALRVDINHHSAVMTFHPQLDYSAGDWEGTFVPQTSSDEGKLDIPANFLQVGDNLLTLTTIDTPAEAQTSLGDIAPGISGIVYDALALTYSHQQTSSRPTISHAEATVFFRNSTSGLLEKVSLCITSSSWKRPTRSANLRYAGKAVPFKLFGDQDFGERCADVDLPAWDGTLDAKVLFQGIAIPIQLKAQKRWTVHIVPNEHLDVGFTDYRGKVAELQSRSIDEVLDLLPQHPDFRWTLDGSWVADEFLAARSSDQRKRLFDAVRSGKIVLPPQYANQHTAVASLEGLIRSLYFSHRLAAQNGLSMGAAHITDVPSYSWSYASILHDAGIKYFAAGSNNWRAPVLLFGRWNEKTPFYWEGPDGGRVLMWYSRAYLQLASMFGVPPQVESVHDALPVFLQAYSSPGYRANATILFGSQLENTPLDPGQMTLPAAWQKEYAYPKLDFSTFADALADIERQMGADIPVYRGDFGPYWEDGYTADAAATAQHRNNQQRILSAEKMATAPPLMRPSIRPDSGLLASAWKNTLLFDEHTWTYVGATSKPDSDQSRIQLAQKTATATNAAEEIEESVQRSWAQIELMLARPEPSIAVWNTLSWERSGWLETDLDDGQTILDPDTRKAVPQEVIRREPGTHLPGFGSAAVRVRFRAANVPSLGWKVFPVAVSGTALNGNAPQITEVIENDHYKIKLSAKTGAISAIYDKDLQRNLVDAESPFSFGATVYVSDDEPVAGNSLYRFGVSLPPPHLDTHLQGNGRIVSVYADQEGLHAILESSNVQLPYIRTEILLPSDDKRIDLTISLRKSATLSKEAVYVAFPFSLPGGQFGYDTQNGWVDPSKDELAGGSREWYAAQHWASVRNGKYFAAVVPVDAPMVNFGDIVRGLWPKEFRPKSSGIFSWIMSNYWNTNFPAEQSGNLAFHYTILSGADFSPSFLTHKSLETMTPLEMNSMNPAQPGPSTLPASGSVLSLNTQDVQVSTWKMAELQDGTVLRLEEISGTAQTVQVELPLVRIQKAYKCSILEDRQAEIPAREHELTVSLNPWEIATVCLQTEP